MLFQIHTSVYAINTSLKARRSMKGKELERSPPDFFSLASVWFCLPVPQDTIIPPLKCQVNDLYLPLLLRKDFKYHLV